MKDCRDCEFFEGYDYEDGTPKCDCEEGYEGCPYNDIGEVIQKGMKIEIDTGFMHDYIRHTLKNTIECETISIAKDEIKNLITQEIKEKVFEEMDCQIKSIVSEEISNFLKKEITIGGGWSEPERKLTREQYLSETIEKELANRFKPSEVKSLVGEEVKNAIDKYTRSLRDEINTGIRTYFDTATRNVLTENVVSMLMCNDTYQKLSNSMQTFLPDKAK